MKKLMVCLMALAFVTAGFAQASQTTNSQTATQGTKKATPQTVSPTTAEGTQTFNVEVTPGQTVQFTHDGTYFWVKTGTTKKQLKTGWEKNEQLTLKPLKAESKAQKTEKGTYITLVYVDQNKKTHTGKYDVNKQELLEMQL